MRMVPYMPLSTTTITTLAPCCTAVANSWPFIRKQPSPANDTTRRLGAAILGGYRRRHAVAHGAAGRRKLGAKAAILEEAMQEGGVVARSVGDDDVVGQALVQPADHFGDV